MSQRATDRRIPAELESEMSPAVRAFVGSLLDKIDRLETVIDGLRKTPENSSLPPSSQHPHAKPPRPRRREKTKRRRGGQPGHRKHERTLIPTEQCDSVVEIWPSACRRCGKKLPKSDKSPLRHQVWEIPEIKPKVTEYQLHRSDCDDCGETTCGQLPPDVPRGQSGSRLVAFAALLMAYFRQSKRRTALFLNTLLGQPCSVGLTVKMQTIATEAMRPTYEQLASQLPEQAQLGIDESPSKQGTTKTWLWTFVASAFTVFVLRPTRAASVLIELLRDRFSGVVMCDRAKMYWHLGRLQWCWAHLQRDFQALIDSHDPQVRRLGHDLMRPTIKLFRHWSRCRDGTITRRGLKRLMAPIRREVEGLLLRGAFSGNPRLVGMCRELYDHRQWLWTFLDHEAVEPTNNASERSLRHAVIWRKLSFGTQSDGGNRFVETMLTVIETCRQQSRNVLEFVTAAVQAKFERKPAPSLLPNV